MKTLKGKFDYICCLLHILHSTLLWKHKFLYLDFESTCLVELVEPDEGTPVAEFTTVSSFI